MILKPLHPRQTLSVAFLRMMPNRAEMDNFKAHLALLLDGCSETESEEFHKNLISDFFKDAYYKQNHFINTKGRNDLVIHNGQNAKSNVGVIIEVKKMTNKAEMVTKDNLNKKAFHELVLYYLREKITHKNIELKHLIVTNINEWFIFDAQIFDKTFAQNKDFVKQFNDFEEGRLANSKTDFFYKQIAEPFINHINSEIEFAYFNLQDYRAALQEAEKELDLMPLYKIFSPEHLLKLPFANDSNSLDKGFYNELLHILGLTEVKESGKKLIKRNKEGERNSGTILEEAISQLDSLNKLTRLPHAKNFGATQQERLFNVAIELSITWINRILFLKLLEAQLVSYHKSDKTYSFLNLDKIKNYDDLNSLFFQVLARQHHQRNEDVKTIFEKVPYLNSSLFEPTELEHNALFINGLNSEKTIPVFSQTVLKDRQGNKKTGNLRTIEYLFGFLDAYDFGTEGKGEIREESKTLISASVLGLIFEKINGYKDGSFFTPGFITMYMCKETIRKAVVQKFNEVKKWNCKDLNGIYDKIEDRKEANQIINSLKICDPAVGSGHFLVSALNEIIEIKSELKILEDKNGKSLNRYHIKVENDELSIMNQDGEIFEYKPKDPESQRVQETIFHEKQSIIESCLFGVDINPNSVKICRLRLWIELLKNAYYKNINELETLPNIDINIKCGNSLVSRFALDADIKQVLKKSKWTIESYRKAVSTYRNAENKEQKWEMERLISDIKSDVRTEIAKKDPKLIKKSKLEGELFILINQTAVFGESEKEKKEKAGKIDILTKEINKIEAEIEEMQSNPIYENAFEWRFEFPEVLNEEGDFVGFDVVIGNPPYVDYREIDKAQITHLQNFKTLEESPRPNLYQFFIELSYIIMNQKAHFCYINPTQFLSIDAGYGIRRFIVENTIIQFIDDISNIKVFDEAATYTVVWSFRKEKNGNYPVRISKCKSIEDIGQETLLVRKNDIIANGKYLIIANVNQVVIGKIELNKVKLATLCDMIWGTSQSGYGKKKILAEQYTQLDNKEKQKYAPIIQTRDIKNYVIDWKKEYIPREIFSNNAIAKFETKEKIVIARMTLRLQAAIDQKQCFVGKSTVLFNINKKIKPYFLLALLNSKIINFWYKNYFENTHLSGGYIRFDIPYMKKIPIAIPSTDLQNKIIKLVKQILVQKEKGQDTSKLEAQIDRLVYELYDLTEEEIKIVEKS
ncbi:DUF7149 domain-containing protein [Hugenholtzia roseola]|uniref:type IIG restriction enzyme/methyltransferase n=1 Tax=Hugenholtzia roseola TaxID=1002 RepID=UPI0003F91DDB|nr:TaqI-like C-terminal specificity domain-containing protein [Hugenholtzia roseola]